MKHLHQAEIGPFFFFLSIRVVFFENNEHVDPFRLLSSGGRLSRSSGFISSCMSSLTTVQVNQPSSY